MLSRTSFRLDLAIGTNDDRSCGDPRENAVVDDAGDSLDLAGGSRRIGQQTGIDFTIKDKVAAIGVKWFARTFTTTA